MKIRNRRKWKGKYPIKCSKCGKDFLGDKPNRKYCSNVCANNIPQKVEKVCLYCGNIYTIPPNQTKQSKWCSRECYDSYRQIFPSFAPGSKEKRPENPEILYRPKPEQVIGKRRQYNLTCKHIGQEYPCEMCDKPMILKGTGQKYCDECIPNVDKIKRKQKRRENGNFIENETIRNCVICGDEFVARAFRHWKCDNCIPARPTKEIIPCKNCNWSLATCDTHHIIPKSKGGTDSFDNLIVLCPNCHRLAHRNILTQELLYSLKKKLD